MVCGLGVDTVKLKKKSGWGGELVGSVGCELTPPPFGCLFIDFSDGLPA